MSKKTMEINLAKFDGPVYSGRIRGEKIRNELGLDSIDQDLEMQVNVVVPENTYTVTSSFFLGLFGPSIVRAGSADRFYEKFRITAQQAISERISSFVDRALQQKALFG